VELPRLAQRPEDVPGLADHFVKHFAARSGKKQLGISSDALVLLRDYDFPGNVRELRNIIEQAVLSADGHAIGPNDLPEYVRSATRLMQSRARKPSLAEIEAVYIREILEYTRGNKTRAAEILGISRKNLYEKMRRYKIGASIVN
jgi:DNA-binding NtrC family response regulator